MDIGPILIVESMSAFDRDLPTPSPGSQVKAKKSPENPDF
jgi:hypothetical protein